MYVLTRTSVRDLNCMHRGLSRKTLVLVDHGGIKTLRQMPENHQLAAFQHGEWVQTHDPAANRSLQYVVFELLFYHELRWDATGGQRLIDAIDELKEHSIKEFKKDEKLHKTSPRGQFVMEYKCPSCASEQFHRYSLMQGGVNCWCESCDLLFHIYSF